MAMCEMCRENRVAYETDPPPPEMESQLSEGAIGLLKELCIPCLLWTEKHLETEAQIENAVRQSGMLN